MIVVYGIWRLVNDYGECPELLGLYERETTARDVAHDMSHVPETGNPRRGRHSPRWLSIETHEVAP